MTTEVVSSTGDGRDYPIGTIMAFVPDFTGFVAPSSNWVLCDGSTLADSASVYNGVALPSLNGTAQFLRGNSTSGGTGGANSHTNSVAALMNEVTDGSSSRTDTFASASNVPPYYDVVYYIRVK